MTTGANELTWDFGDGDTIEWNSTDNEIGDANYSPTHLYREDGVFDVTLTVNNFLGDQFVTTQTVTGLVLSTVPDFTFTVSQNTVTFTDNSLLAESHFWDFGDGNTSEEENPVHTYESDGTFNVTLTTTNTENVSRSITMPVPVGGIMATRAAVILNGTMDDFMFDDGVDGDGNPSDPAGLDNRTDNADAWDMTPNSTVVDNDFMTVDSPFTWRNDALNTFIETLSPDNEAPGTTTNANTGRFGITLREIQRRAYQPIEVEAGVEYTITLWVRVENTGEFTLHILDNEIQDESTLVEDALTEPLVVTGGVNNNNVYEQYTITFTATGNLALFYGIPTGDLGNDNEVFIDDIEIITPGF